MLHDAVWVQAMPNYKEVSAALRAQFPSRGERHTDPRSSVQLCFDCVEKRLGRPLTDDDFPLVPVNAWVSASLRERITRGMPPEVAWDGNTVWVNSAKGMCVGRFSRVGVDVHNDFDTQVATGKQCMKCTHTCPTMADWDLFVLTMTRLYGASITEEHKPTWLEQTNDEPPSVVLSR